MIYSGDISQNLSEYFYTTTQRYFIHFIGCIHNIIIKVAHWTSELWGKQEIMLVATKFQ